MAEVVIYTTGFCPYCDRAKALLQRKGVQYEELRVDEDDLLKEEMVNRSHLRTVPQIFIDDQHIGGCDELYEFDRQGNLDVLLKK